MKEAAPALQKYLDLVATYNTEFKKWEERTRKIIRRYRDDNRGQSNTEMARFNILWSNVQTLIPAVYAKMPKPDVSRRFADTDPIARVASALLQRSLSFEMEHYPDFRATMTAAVQDRFLGGRGVAWARYEPHMKAQPGTPVDGLEVTEDIDETGEEIDYECAPVDYVHWHDFGHTVARTWEEVTAVWRWVYMTRDALTDRFGEEIADKIPTDTGPDPLQNKASKRDADLARICEMWDKQTGKVCWFYDGGDDLIEEVDDPLGLEQFFPCPRPLYATMTSDTLVPVPDFLLYQDQANELDILTDRIDGLIKALRVRGVYDASQPALQRLLTEGDNNTLVPVDKWMAFSEKGGLKGSIDLLPLDVIVTTLIQAYQAHAQVKQQVYEITGISDIIRGQSAASETATAQQIKGQYAGLRLKALQSNVALFATELLRLKAHIICSKFQEKTIFQYADAGAMSAVDQQAIPQAMALLKSNVLRAFRIEVASDSLIQIDDAQVKEDRVKFITAMGAFLQNAVPVVQANPRALPILIELMKFGVSAFKEASQVEGVLDATLDEIKAAQQKEQANPQPRPPDPEMEKAKAELQIAQQKSQAEQQLAAQKMQAEQQLAMQKMQVEQQVAQAKVQAQQAAAQNSAAIDAQKMQADIALEQQKLDLQARVMSAKIDQDERKLQADMALARMAQADKAAQARSTAAADAGDAA